MMLTTAEDWRSVLKCEFESDDGSFLSLLTEQHRWDKEAFRELVEAMRVCCVECSEDDHLERWMAHGFFYVPAFIRAWTMQDGFAKPDERYWNRAIELLDVLSHWFFWGEPPTENGSVDVLMLE